ncbi:MAG: hypothetical protein KKA42_01095 [candidate division Zixibacteria bacterium]|nr:hypothetical protein [candidate division Zixibacteria bacterium]
MNQVPGETGILPRIAGLAIASGAGESFHPFWWSGRNGEEAAELAYFNAATCPDCSGAMIRQGRCCVCPSCGFETCAM